MEVWVVVKQNHGSPAYIEGVYLTEKLAEEAKKRMEEEISECGIMWYAEVVKQTVRSSVWG